MSFMFYSVIKQITKSACSLSRDTSQSILLHTLFYQMTLLKGIMLAINMRGVCIRGSPKEF